MREFNKVEGGYEIEIDGVTRTYRTMFNRSDMAYYGFSSADVTPPIGRELAFDKRGEPYFKTARCERESPDGTLQDCYCADCDIESAEAERIWEANRGA